MKHNHPPRCCCSPTYPVPDSSPGRCPGCPKHGELANILGPIPVICGFRNLGDPSLICDYPPHTMDRPHSWQPAPSDRVWPKIGPPAYVERPDGTTAAATPCIDPHYGYPSPHTHPDLVAGS